MDGLKKNEAGTESSGKDMKDNSPSPEAAEARLVRRRKLILWSAITANILGNSGLVGVNVALPAMGSEFNLTAFRLGWVSLATLLVMAISSAPTARLSDLVGRHRIAVFGMVTTMVAALIGALSYSYVSLMVSRALLGLGLVSYFTTITTMVAAEYPAEERGRVLGLTISAVYIGLSLGPMIVGMLVQYLGWRSLFWFTLIGNVPPLILLLMVEPDLPPTPDEKLDWIGILLWVLTLGLGFTGLASLKQTFAIPMLTIGVAMAVLFFLRSLKSKNPILDMRLFFDSRSFSFSSLAAYISYLSSFSISFLMSLYLQYAKGLSPSKAGLYLMAQPVIQAMLTPISGRLSDSMAPWRLASKGIATIMVAILIFALTLSSVTPDLLLIVTMAMTGVGFAFFSAPNTNAIMSAVPPKRLGQASGVITVTRLCGQITSMAVTTLVFGLVIGSGVITAEKSPELIRACVIIFWIFAPVCLVGVLASLTGGKKSSA
ncbi:MAG: MFS transporter [Deltaproteobacteria bacterium]|jgi:MFS family permease|nr:MFS transporter [Deltaproteobacteria bacterium]